MSFSGIFHPYEDITIAIKGLQNLDLCLGLRAIEQEGIFFVPHLLQHGVLFFFSGFIEKITPFSCLLRHAREC
jgi:hypothetical protein